MLSRAPFVSVRVAPPIAKRRLNRDGQRILIDRIADIMRPAEPTPFAAEGPCRAGIRANLCLQGWNWSAANKVADEVVTKALNAVGAIRPNWYQGQPEWTQPGALPIERETCAAFRCRKPVPPERRRFCSAECKRSHHDKRSHEANEEARKAYQKAWYAAKPKAAT